MKNIINTAGWQNSLLMERFEVKDNKNNRIMKNKSSMKIKVRKWLPSYVTVTRTFRPKKGPGSYRRNKNEQND